MISELKEKNGNITSDPVVMANISNNYFVNVSQDIAKNLPRSNTVPVDFMIDRNGNSCFAAP